MIKSELCVKKLCADSRIKGKRGRVDARRFPTTAFLILTGPCARDVEMKLAAGPESQKKPFIVAKVLRSDVCAAQEPRKTAEVGRAETGHVLGGNCQKGDNARKP